MLTFNEKEHKYYYEGKEIPSVSSIMKSITSHYYNEKIPQVALDIACEKGHLVHKAIEDYELWGSYELEDQYKGYLEQYMKWKKDYRPIILYQEKMLTNGLYAGTIDMIAEVNGELSIIDFKTSNDLHTNFVSVQLTAYEQLCKYNDIKIKNTYALHLTRKSYNLVKLDFNINMWEKCLECYNFGKEDGDIR